MLTVLRLFRPPCLTSTAASPVFPPIHEVPTFTKCTVTVGLRLPLHPMQGGEAYSGYPLFASPSFRSSRPRQKCLTYTPLARGISTSICCFSLHHTAMWSYLLPTSHIAALRCSLILRLQTWIHPRISFRISHIQPQVSRPSW